jgi:hypothetical protein
MFGVYPSQYKDNYCYVVYSSPHIQGIKWNLLQEHF